MGEDQNQAVSSLHARQAVAALQGDDFSPGAYSVRSPGGGAVLDSGLPAHFAEPPGKILQAELDARDLTQAELAARMNVSAKHVNQIVKGVASLTFDTALRLERTLGIPAAVWNRLESNYQERRVRERVRAGWAREHLGWLRLFPLNALVSRGVLAAEASDVTKLEQLLAFFQVADPDAYERTWAEPVAAGFRRTQSTSVDPYATAAWLRLGEKAADGVLCKQYDARTFSTLLPELRRLTLMPDKQAFSALQQECAAAGVAVVFEPALPGSRVSGAARWITPAKAVIVLSGRYRFHDIFWFAFFHEAAHLILHPKRRVVVDLEQAGDDADGQEAAANAYASAALIPEEYSGQLNARTTASRASEIAREIGVDAGIVAGRLSHQQNNWTRYARLRRKLQDID